MVIDKIKTEELVKGLDEEQRNIVLQSLFTIQIMNDEIQMQFVNNFLKCSEIFNWRLTTITEVVELMVDFIISIYNDNDVQFTDSSRILALVIVDDEEELEIDFYCSL